MEIEGFTYISLKDYNIYALKGNFYCYHKDQLKRFIKFESEDNIQSKVVLKNILYNIGLILTLIEVAKSNYTNSIFDDLVAWWLHILFNSEKNEQVEEAVLFVEKNCKLLNSQIECKKEEEIIKTGISRRDVIEYYVVPCDSFLLMMLTNLLIN